MDAIEDKARKLSFGILNELARAGNRLLRSLGRADHQTDVIYERRNAQRIAHRIHRGRIDDHAIKSLNQSLNKRGESIRAEQLAGIGRLVSRADDSKVFLRSRHQDLIDVRISCEIIRQSQMPSGNFGVRKDPMDGGQTQVGIHKHRLLSFQSKSHGSVEGAKCLALSGDSAGHKKNAAVRLIAQQGERSAHAAKGLRHL